MAACFVSGPGKDPAREGRAVARFHSDDFIASAAWSRVEDAAEGKGGAGEERLIGAFGRTIRLHEPVPIRDRVQAREARRRAVAEAAPMVERLFGELHDSAAVVERINADTSLDEARRRAALQEALRRGLQARTPGEPSR